MLKSLDFRFDDEFIQKLEDMLQKHGLELSASEFHGTMTGLACSGYSDKDIKEWQDLMVGQYLPFHHTQPILDAMSGLIALIQRSLEKLDFNFQLLLPATIGITEQTTSVTSWCRGFILGFSWNKSIVKESLEPDAIEALIDIAQIADAQSSGDAPESQERALVELEEYLRVCAQLIYEAVRSSIAQNPTTR